MPARAGTRWHDRPADGPRRGDHIHFHRRPAARVEHLTGLERLQVCHCDPSADRIFENHAQIVPGRRPGEKGLPRE